MATTEHRPTERVLDILELLSNSEEGMTLTELAKALNAPKSSIMPLVHTMTARNFIYMQKNTLRYFIGVATYSVDYYQLGYQTGLMAAKVLAGEAKIADLAIETQKEIKLTVNEERAKKLGITIPEALRKDMKQ